MDRRMGPLLFSAALAGAVLLASLIATEPVLAGTFFVDQSHPLANDSNPGTETLPWRTLQRAMSVVAGDTVFVKNGTYNATTESGGTTNDFRPQNFGTATAPIAFRAFTGHRPVLTRDITPCQDSIGNPTNCNVILVVGQHSVVWDGFTLAPRTDVGVWFANDVILENLVIDKGPIPSTPADDNYNGIWVQSAARTVIRNNILRNIYFTFPGGSIDNHTNAAAIVLWDTTNTRIHNNEISRSNAAISDKRNGVSNVYERNYIHDVNGVGVIMGAGVTPACGTCPVRDNVVRHNVIVNAPLGVNINFSFPDNPAVGNLQVHNNTMHAVFMGVRSGVIPGTAFFNNVITITGSSARSAQYDLPLLASPTPAGLLLDFSNFRAPVSPHGRFLTDDFGSFETLSQWRTRGFDLHSREQDPLFVEPVTGSPPPVEGFRLQATSPLINAGRVGGVEAGSPITMGAFLSDSDVIGPGFMLDTVPPSAPASLTVR